MNIVMIIPTGIGCVIGGHAGDAAPAAKLLGSCGDRIILHPNVVNASDINEMPDNAWYVEGSILDRFLEGSIELEETYQNRILLAVNYPVKPEIINAVSAARATIGAYIRIVELKTPLKMIGTLKNNVATGEITGWEELIEQVWQYDLDALAIASIIEVSDKVCLKYYKEGGTNPWGGVEAKLSKLLASELDMPVAHAPVEGNSEETQAAIYNNPQNPTMAAEAVTNCYLHCVLKGLHTAPRIGKGLSVDDIDVMVSPFGCWSRPHHACVEAKIPIIMVKENKCVLNHEPESEVILVKNYLEAAGAIMAMKAGISRESIHRPLEPTIILKD
ncbi:MAG TPA: DUF3326 domain-containing protein [Spirochaetes bacterium]|nr:DUF3326 domain-containing protein [Spirochaetota bacterium]